MYRFPNIKRTMLDGPSFMHKRFLYTHRSIAEFTYPNLILSRYNDIR